MIRRCGNCAYGEAYFLYKFFLNLKCANPHSQYQGKRRNAGYFGCVSHVAGSPGKRKQLQ